MPTNIVIPEVGESVTSGVIAAWTVADGDYVERDATVLELETDKITMEVPAPAAGVVKHDAAEGDEVEVGAVVGSVDESADKPSGGKSEQGKSENAQDQPSESRSAEPEGREKAASSSGEDKPASSNGQAATATAEPPKSSSGSASGASSGGSGDGDVHATPLARKLAQELGVSLGGLVGTGAGGRIREQDVLAANGSAADSPAADARPAAPASGSRETRLERMSPMRKSIAARLVEAQQTAAMLTTFNEVDMTAVMALRKAHKEEFGEKHGVGLGFMSFFVKACCAALARFPDVNSAIVPDDKGQPAVERRDFCDVAIAVSSPKGLVVPVLRNAEAMSFAGIESTIKDFGKRAQSGKLELAEMQGGTFTITNGGVFGSLLSTPILNPPQSGILGMHGIKSRPVEHPDKPGEIALRPMMYLALSYDHRIVDGAGAVRFLVAVKDAIENPARLMLDL